MILSDVSIRRPVLATVMSILILLVGAVSFFDLTVREYPDIDPPVVNVQTTYTGASSDVVETQVTQVLEESIAGIEGVDFTSSISRPENSQITVTFRLDRDSNEATNDVRDRVSRVRGLLPDEVDDPVIQRVEADAQPIIYLALGSDRHNPAELTDYADRYIKDRLQTLPGVAQAMILGERRYAMRIWLDPLKLAAYNLTVQDIETALRNQNIEVPAGRIESEQREFTVRSMTDMATPEEFNDLIILAADGFLVRLSDVGKAELGVEDERIITRFQGQNLVALGIVKQAVANPLDVSQAVQNELDVMADQLPDGMHMEVAYDSSVFIDESINNVFSAIGEAVVLVILIIFLFLRSFRAITIPVVTIPVALIGTFAIMKAVGFTVNTLTLLGMVMAVGLVVDDAIVVLENIQRRVDEGESRLVASLMGARQVTFAVIATSLTLIAVFVPISYLEGQAGRLFVEFGLVMASAVAISTFVALTLSPVLASRMLSPHASPNGKPRRRRPMDFVTAFYKRTLVLALRMPLVVIALSLAFAAGSYQIFQNLPSELTPREDRGVIFIPLTSPQGSTVGYTDTQVRKLEADLASLRDSGNVPMIFAVVGSWGRPYRAFVVLRLADWDARTEPIEDLMSKIIPATGKLTGARGFPVLPAGLGLRGSNTPLRVVIGGPDFESVKEWAAAMLEKAEQNPGLRNPEIDFEENQPQLSVAVDRARADDLDIGVGTIATTLQTMLASREVTTYIDRGREYPVIVQAQQSDRTNPNDIDNIFIRSGNGQSLIPLRALLITNEEAASPELRRYDRLSSITLSAALADDYDLGKAIRFIQQTAEETLPPEANIAFSGQSQQYLETSAGVAVTFGLALLIVFLVLAAQFESFMHPLIIMLSVPLAIAGAIYTLWFTGVSLNLYSQIGIILLVGLMAKNGILIVEFANQLRDQDRSVREAVLEASVLRLRPIVMTVLSTILGAVPLVLAFGAGAESRIAIGTVIIGGLGFASMMTLYLTPVLYDLMARHTRPRGAIEKALEQELQAPKTAPETPAAE